MYRASDRPEPRDGLDAPRPCPTCGDPMARVELHSIPLDRCPIDGIWFDWPELQVALASAALPDDDWRSRFAQRLAKMT